jgi:hypothetical protein
MDAYDLIVIGTGTAAQAASGRVLTVDDLKSTMFAYPTGASDIGYML